jgi:DNA-binding NtrC family response regulator
MANGGTLFLDEIGDISLETQVKLLRVLQERAFEPVGGTRTVQVDVRLIAATHQNLERLIADGRFREDLFYRLNVISITLPPLREREHDVFELALYFLERAATRVGKRITHIDEEALEALRGHRWPGNIRELENVVERAVVLAEGTSITLLDLPPEVTSPAPYLSIETKPQLLEVPRTIETTRNAGEREQLLQALREANGNKAQAARLLGLPRSTFFSKLKKHAIRVD